MLIARIVNTRGAKRVTHVEFAEGLYCDIYQGSATCLGNVRGRIECEKVVEVAVSHVDKRVSVDRPSVTVDVDRQAARRRGVILSRSCFLARLRGWNT